MPISKCTIATARPDRTSGVEFEITHWLVSGDT